MFDCELDYRAILWIRFQNSEVCSQIQRRRHRQRGKNTTKRKKYNKEGSFKLCNMTVCIKWLCSWITIFIHTLFMTPLHVQLSIYRFKIPTFYVEIIFKKVGVSNLMRLRCFIAEYIFVSIYQRVGMYLLVWKDEKWGQYYKFSDLSEIKSEKKKYSKL